MQPLRPVLAATLASLLAACGGGGDDNAGAPASPRTVTIAFDAIANGGPARCGSTLGSLGSPAVSAALRDLRFYVTNVRLISAGGASQPVTLATNDFQSSGVALLNFNDGSTAACGGTAMTLNTGITGTVAAGSYTGIEFEVGVPESVNHSDYAASAAPLNVVAMAWSWQYGRKFLKIEVDPAGGITRPSGSATAWYTHLGSTGCAADSASSTGYTCTNSNRMPVRLASFNLDSQKVVLNLNALFTDVNLALDQGGATGCMSDGTDADCAAIFANMKIDLATGAPISGGSTSQAMFIAAGK
ncbi:MbnP family copper-binding protein [Derxia gummosa]|uniref:MbnP family copper-binding protein n=1 Tax=Derxia gummosa DSM 723 TaxID=1121388 RepID=A0A8B6X7H7_9BURK|nr:MbnP family copper-binding protein [Derxia gummosa]